MDKRIVRRKLAEEMALHYVINGDVGECQGCSICTRIMKLGGILEGKAYKYLVFKNKNLVGKFHSKKEIVKFLRVSTKDVVGNIHNKRMLGYKIVYADWYLIELEFKKESKKDIKEMLRQNPGITPSKIVDRLGLSYEFSRRILNEIKRDEERKEKSAKRRLYKQEIWADKIFN